MFDIDKNSSSKAILSEEHQGRSNPGVNLEEYLHSLSHLHLDYLRELRYQLGRIAHENLLELHKRGDSLSLAIADDSCIGMVSDALSSNDGSSRYLTFTINVSNQAAQIDAGYFKDDALENPASSRLSHLESLAETHELQADLFLGIVPDPEKTSSCTVFCGTSNAETTREVIKLPPLSEEVQKESAAIACLCSLINTTDRMIDSDSSEAVTKLLTTLPFVELSSEQQGFLDKTRSIRGATKRAWKRLSEFHETYRLAPIALGESFTLGRLAQRINSLDASGERLAFAYGWYHPDAKKVFGVQAEQLSSQNIAEPETVLQGAFGLLERGPGHPGISLATSGWANNNWLQDHASGMKNDFFSVASAYTMEDSMQAYAVRVSIADTAESTCSLERRQFARELGVLASLYALSLSLNDDQTSITLSEIAEDLHKVLTEYANIEISSRIQSHRTEDKG